VDKSTKKFRFDKYNRIYYRLFCHLHICLQYFNFVTDKLLENFMQENKGKSIIVKNARINNLKNIDVEFPLNKLIVVTGLSGSGKSSLAFDTLYAEGQRRYVESLSAYARQFLGRMSKPEVDYIKNLPPAIAIEQKVNTRNPRSTVGTSTEIYDYLKLLYARIGKTISPVSGEEVKKHTIEDVIAHIYSLEEDTKALLLSPVSLKGGRTLKEQMELYMKQGFMRLKVNGEVVRIQDFLDGGMDGSEQEIELVIDRFSVHHDDNDFRSRLYDSVQTAYFEGDDRCVVEDCTRGVRKEFSGKFSADGIDFEVPNEHLFSFNNPYGACPKCDGFGKVVGIDENLVVPNKSLSVYEGAIACWRGEVMSEWKMQLVRNADRFDFPIHRPYYQLTDEQRRLLWTGNEYFKGVNDFFSFVEQNQYKIQYRVLLSRYRGKTVCPECGGMRLKKQATYVKVGGKAITELVAMPVKDLQCFFDHLQLSEHDAQLARRLLTEINSRIRFLMNVGLGYLTLNRLSNTFSGGESQRINLTTSLGSSLVGSLYVLDEPSIGLHSRDTDLLIGVLRELRDVGNTVVVVEHDEEIIRAADYIIDIGPAAGRNGGEVVAKGTIQDLLAADAKNSRSLTLKYLQGTENIEVPQRRKWNNYIEIIGATENNLKDVNVKFPLNVMTAVTGVSGSGKSTLVKTIFYPAVKKHYDDDVALTVGSYRELKGSLQLAKNIEFVDQNPIGKSSRANPVTYVKAYDEIRRLFADQQLSKQMGYGPSHFSFNVDGGRCEMCQGDGYITVEMQFMADLQLVCDACHGKRFKSDILEVCYRGKNIYDVLNMTVNQAVEFFSEENTGINQRIVMKLKTLQQVGIGYLKLGQPLSTLSGGESQRVKLAAFLGGDVVEPTIFVFDEPTTGLHIHDVKVLLKAFDALIARGHTVVVIEHNLDVIKCADHVIDLGPEGGENGGTIVAEGTPEAIARCEKSYTGQFLKEKLK